MIGADKSEPNAEKTVVTNVKFKSCKKCNRRHSVLSIKNTRLCERSGLMYGDCDCTNLLVFYPDDFKLEEM